MGFKTLLIGVVCGGLAASGVCAGIVSLLDTGGIARKPLLKPLAQATSVGPVTRTRASLFIDRQNTGLFAERLLPPADMPDVRRNGLQGSAVLLIRDVIEQAESRRWGYDAVQHGARIKPARKPTQLTVAEIYDWIEATPGQPHAIGRYQFIPTTLRRVMAVLGESPQQMFSPGLQDRLADVLLAEAGYHDITAGRLSRREFMNNLAKIWAGLPNDTGKSHYAGYAGNKASMTWAHFDAQLAQVFRE